MSFLSVNNLRNSRSSNQNKMYVPAQMSISNLHTDSKQSRNMQTMIEQLFPTCDNNEKTSFGDELFIKNLHLIPDPLKKNLADTLVTEERPKPKPKMEEQREKPPMNHRTDTYPTLAGITSFFSGVLNVLTSAVFRRPQSPSFYDCVDSECPEMAPLSWQLANCQREDKNVAEPCLNCNKTNLELTDPDVSPDPSTMGDCKSAALLCEDKLKRVQDLLTSKKPQKEPVRRRKRPKKVFVDSGSVGESFEDAFSFEELVSEPNTAYTEFFTPTQYHIDDYFEIQSPCLNIKTHKEQTNKETSTNISRDSLNHTTLCSDQKPENLILNTQMPIPQTVEVNDKLQVVSSCEDKLAKLKALLGGKCRRAVPEPDRAPTNPVPIKIKDKKYKNPNRSTCKRKKSRMKRAIEEDMLFANEIDLDVSSAENSPRMLTDRCPLAEESFVDATEYFDEVRGRFRSDSTTDSESSFQIVVADSLSRHRRQSDCESEDSFIVFEDTPDSCYTSNEVFDDSDPDDDSGLSDSGCMTALSHALTKTVTNLTEGCLYEDRCTDEVDCAFDCEPECGVSAEDDKRSESGVLLDDTRKLSKKNMPQRKVTFSSQPPKVHVMRVWSFAAKQARIGHWESYARDRDRFKRRIADVDMAVSWVLKPQHRSRVVFQRFMPWWNAEKRRELAEKKAADEKLMETLPLDAEVSNSAATEAKEEGGALKEAVGSGLSRDGTDVLKLVVEPNSSLEVGSNVGGLAVTDVTDVSEAKMTLNVANANFKAQKINLNTDKFNPVNDLKYSNVTCNSVDNVPTQDITAVEHVDSDDRQTVKHHSVSCNNNTNTNVDDIIAITDKLSKITLDASVEMSNA